MSRGHYGSADTRRFGRGHYGKTPATAPFATMGTEGPSVLRPIRVPVLDNLGDLTKRFALWDLPGRTPAFYLASNTGEVWLFDDPNGELELFGRHLRMFHPFTKATIIGAEPGRARPIHRVPVLDGDGIMSNRRALYVLPGLLPNFYFESQQGGTWLFEDPIGEVFFPEAPATYTGLRSPASGRRFRAVFPTYEPLVTIAGAYDPIVGQGSLVHVPVEISDELNELNNEIKSFDRELEALTDKAEAKQWSGDPEIKRLRAEFDSEEKRLLATRPFIAEIERIKKQMVDPISAASHAQELTNATVALEKFMPFAKREKSQELLNAISDKIATRKSQLMGDDVLTKFRPAWRNFKDGWTQFFTKKDTWAQQLPGSGTWDHIQEYRQQFLDLYKKAPFKPSGSTPLDPGSRKDPSLTAGIGDVLGSVGSILKYTVIGVLVIGGAVVLGSLATTLKSGKDPVEHYAGVYRGRQKTA